MWAEILHQALDSIAILLILYYIGIPLLSGACDMLAWAWRKITGNKATEKETDEQMKLLEESKAFMLGKVK